MIARPCRKFCCPRLTRSCSSVRTIRTKGIPGFILTGAPGSGKTTILRMLEINGDVVVEEAATDTIALDHALGHKEPWNDHAFIDKVVTLQRQRQSSVRAAASTTVFFDRSPVCTLALSRYLGFATSQLLEHEVDRIVAEGVYEQTVFFVRNQGFVRSTTARRISFEDSLVFERSMNRPTESSGSGSPRFQQGR